MGEGSPPGKERLRASFGAGGSPRPTLSSLQPSRGSTPASWGALPSTPGPAVSPPGAELCSGWVLVGLPLACLALS